MDAVALAATGSGASGEVFVFGSVEGFSPGSLEKLNEPPALCGTNRVAITILPCCDARAWSVTRTRKPIGLLSSDIYRLMRLRSRLELNDGLSRLPRNQPVRSPPRLARPGSRYARKLGGT